MLLYLVPALSAVGYRIRGSDLFASVTGGRAIKLAIGSGPVALAGYLAGVPLWAAALVWVGTAAMDSIGHADGMDLGRMGGSWIRDAALLMVSGVASCFMLNLALFLYNPLPLVPLVVLGAALKPLVYELGWRFPVSIQRLALRQGPEWGEFFFGFSRVAFVFFI